MRTRGHPGTTHRVVLGALLILLTMACNGPVRSRDDEFDILGYSISGQASGTDAVTGEEFVCVFTIDNVDTEGPLIGSWTDTTAIKVIRLRRTPTLSVTYDTTISAQEVSVTVADSFHIQVTVTGPLTEDLTADMIPAYPDTALANGPVALSTRFPECSPRPCSMADGIPNRS
jgi:hypothetical protein